ncbi:voltage-dependent T-type calcium channel subunit alpha-1H isoform X2 [Syngnathus scovelli]|uniref:voltage-dependent T-type calcium channel subunit alpha-1H isoform X2 n=1 Tax=Syngnathus scovelli TaxID=161590 RepID=UPI0021109C95|nr:voltage-dependent T-type calcium channel subunit alpha-1H isoform X2 [Syngnathus scovelli]
MDGRRSPVLPVMTDASEPEAHSGGASPQRRVSPEGEEEEAEKLPYPWLAPVVLLALTQSSPPRSWCLRAVCHPWFERVSILAILLNCVTLGMFQPCDDTPVLLQALDDGIFAFFAGEMLVKMVALGIVGHNGYLGDPWNRLDFFIVVVGMLEYSLDGHNVSLSAIRTVRVLRPLRAINRVPSMRILVTLLLDTLPMLGNVLALCFFVFFIFGVVGVQLWAGLLRNRCFMADDVKTRLDVSTLSLYYRPGATDEHPFICSAERDNGMLRCADVPRRRVAGRACSLAAGERPAAAAGAGPSCVNWHQYYNECRAGELNPHKGAINFDNIGYAWIAIFQVITLEGWVDIMYYVMDAHSFYNFIYFIFLIIVGSFFMINLCLVVIATQFSETKQREHQLMKSEQRARQLHQSASTLASDSQPGSCYEEMIRYAAHLGRKAGRRLSRTLTRAAAGPLCARRRRDRSQTNGLARRHSGHVSGDPPRPLEERGPSNGGYNYPVIAPLLRHPDAQSPHRTRAVATETDDVLPPQPVAEHGGGADEPGELPSAAACPHCDRRNRAWRPCNESPGGRTPGGGGWACWAQVRSKLELIVASRYFNRGIMMAILINTLSMGIEYHQQPQELTDMLEISNVVFTSVFSLEMLLKVAALGLWGYVKNPYDGFDGVIVVISVWEVAGQAQGGLSVLRTFRLLRVLKLVRFLPALRRQLLVLVKTMDNVATFCMLLVLFIFIFSILGMHLFGCKFGLRQDSGDTLPDRKNFDSLLWATVTVFQILTQEDWNAVLYNGMASTTPVAALYFVALMTFGNYVLFNLLVAILVEGFQAEGDASRSDWDDEARSLSYEDEEKLRELYAAELKIWAMIGSPNGPLNPRASMPVVGQAEATPIVIYASAAESLQQQRSPLFQRQDTLGPPALSTEGPPQSPGRSAETESPLSQRGRTAAASDDADETLYQKVRKLLEPYQPEWCAQHGDWSFFVFAPRNRFRLWCQKTMGHKMFDPIILLFIFLNCITIALERPDIQPHSMERAFLSVSNHIFTLIFVGEMMIKVVALGVCFGEGVYLQSSWNVLDGVLVAVSLADILASAVAGGNRILGILRVLRLLRTLRPLRVISRAPGLKLVVETLITSLRPIGNIVLICCAFFIVFGILGVQLFKGKFFHCDGFNVTGITNKTQCLDAGHRWLRRKYNFDNLGQALMSLFVLSCKDGWVSIMYDGLDAVGVDQQPVRNNNPWMLLFFISFLLIVSFFVLNMFVGVVVENFHKCRQQQEEEEARLREEKRRKRLEKRRRSELLDCGQKPSKGLSPKTLSSACMLCVCVWGGGAEFMGRHVSSPHTHPHSEIIAVHVRTRAEALEKPYYADYSPLRRSIHSVCTSHYLDLFITIIIFTNLLTMSMEHYKQPQYLVEILKYCNYVFTLVFVIEAVLKLVALGLRRFFKDRWNQLDLAIVLLSIMGITLEEIDLNASLPINPTIIRIMRVLRITRVLKLLKMATGMRALLDTVMQALPQVGNLGLLFMLLFFIYAALGVELFGKLECSEENPCEGLSRHATFHNFGMAFLTLFRVSTGDNWNGIMKDTLRECRPGERHCLSYLPLISPVYFVTFVLTAQFVLVNVVVAVLMKHLEESNKEAQLEEMEERREREEEAARRNSAASGGGEPADGAADVLAQARSEERCPGKPPSFGRMLSLPGDGWQPLGCVPYDACLAYGYSGSVSSLGSGSSLQVPGALPSIGHASLGSGQGGRPVIRLSRSIDGDSPRRSGPPDSRRRLDSARSVDGCRSGPSRAAAEPRRLSSAGHSLDGCRPALVSSCSVDRQPSLKASGGRSQWLSPEASLDRNKLSPSYVPDLEIPTSFRAAGRRLRRQEAVRCDSADQMGSDDDISGSRLAGAASSRSTPPCRRSPSVHTSKFTRAQRIISCRSRGSGDEAGKDTGASEPRPAGDADEEVRRVEARSRRQLAAPPPPDADEACGRLSRSVSPASSGNKKERVSPPAGEEPLATDSSVELRRRTLSLEAAAQPESD